MKNTLIYIGIIVIILGGMYASTKMRAGGTSGVSEERITAFAQCLAAKKITMYGAEWCSHCQREKGHFGTAFQYVPYVECTDNQKLCLDMGVQGYPTWIDAAGTKYPGEQGLDGLAKITSCTLWQLVRRMVY